MCYPVPLRIALFFISLIALGGCSVTPELRSKEGGMAMGLKSAAPILLRAEISPDQRYLVTGDFKETATLWDLDKLRPVRKVRTERGIVGAAPGLSISPDGRLLALGGKNIQLLQLSDGAPVGVLERTGHTGAIAWAPDGSRLITAGPASMGILSPATGPQVSIWDTRRWELVRHLPVAGLDPSKIVNVIEESRSIAVSPDGRFLMIGYLPKTIEVWDLQTQKKLRELAGDNDSFFANSGVMAVAISPDGRQAASATFRGEIWLWDFPAMTLQRKIKADDSWMSGIDLAYSPDGRVLVSGSAGNGKVKIWNAASGTLAREFSAHSGIAGTNSVRFTPDGKRLVTAGDASVRIWNFETAEEIATLVSFEDGEWIVTTPNGYYASSPRGDEYLDVNIGGQAYSTARLRESFFRPDLVKLALSGGSLREFRKVADVKPAPSVAFLDPPASVSGQEVSLSLRVTDAGGGIGDVRLYLNGTAVALDGARGLQPVNQGSAQVRRFIVRLPAGPSELRAVAFNGDNSMQGAEVTHRLTATPSRVVRPSLHALVVGINEYRNPKLTLNYAVADAQLFAETLRAVASPLFENVRIRTLTGRDDTTRERVLAELQGFRDLHPDDLFVFYVAGHGTVDEGEYFMLTSNVGSTSLGKLKADAISQNSLKDILANIPSTKKLVVIDTCNAGKLGDAIQSAMLTRGMSEDTAIKLLGRAVGSTILSASTSMQEALEGHQGHGLFTFVLVEGLRGKADKGRTGYVKTTDLANYVDDEVPALAERLFKRAQYPTISISGQGFPVGQAR